MALAVVSVVALLASACGAASEAGDDGTQATSGEQLSIVATTNILGDVASEVAGGAADVVALMPPGSDPHNFEASAQQLAQMQEADLVVANGADLEPTLADALVETEDAGVPVFHATDHIETLAFDGDDEHAEDEHAEDEHAEDEHASEDASEDGDEHASEDADEHAEEEQEHGSVDPHFWMDPTRMADVARVLGDQIGELSGDATAVADRADDYAQRLTDVDAETQDMLATISEDQRKLVTNHEAFGYFADRYDFEIVGTVIPSLSTGAEPSAQDLEQLARTITDERVGAIFAENTAPDQMAETLADEVGADVEVVELYSDSLGDEGSDASTYVDLLRTNARRVSEALGG